MTVNKITVQNRLIEYLVKKSYRARRMRLEVNYDGKLHITIPHRFPQYYIEQFIVEKFKWISSKIDYVTKFPRHKTFEPNSTEYKELKEKSFKIISERLEFFKSLYGYEYKRVTIKNQKTCWGSCSKYKNLNFSYKTGLLPNHLRDYVIVHELCHLKQLNHSQKFWDLVAKVFPNYKELRKELRNTSIKL